MKQIGGMSTQPTSADIVKDMDNMKIGGGGMKNDIRSTMGQAPPTN